MKTLTLLSALLLASAGAPAAEAAIEAPTLTPTPTLEPGRFRDSKAAVTPDPAFTVPGYAERWPHVSLAEAKRLQARKDVVFADGRGHSEWETSHIPGAVSLPVGEFDARYYDVMTRLKKSHVIVAYCHGESCRLADHLAQQLVGKGHMNVAVFAGGFPAWSGAKLPLDDKDGRRLKAPKK